jgi:hypothetical protein
MIRLKRFKLDHGRTTLYLLRFFKAEVHIVVKGRRVMMGDHGLNLPYWFMPSFYASHWRYRWRYSPLPVYWSRYSRDCDHCSAEWVERHPNGWTAYSSYCAALDGAEGPERFTAITRSEYLAERGHTNQRDHIMEAHEDGHPYSVGE